MGRPGRTTEIPSEAKEETKPSKASLSPPHPLLSAPRLIWGVPEGGGREGRVHLASPALPPTLARGLPVESRHPPSRPSRTRSQAAAVAAAQGGPPPSSRGGGKKIRLRTGSKENEGQQRMRGARRRPGDGFFRKALLPRRRELPLSEGGTKGRGLLGFRCGDLPAARRRWPGGAKPPSGERARRTAGPGGAGFGV